MSVIDIVLLVIAIIALVSGGIRGFIAQIGSLAGLILGVICCRFFGAEICQVIGTANSAHPLIYRVLTYTVVFLLVYISSIIIAKLIRKVVNSFKLGFIDRIIGALFRLFLWSVLISIVLNIYFSFAPSHKDLFIDNKPWRALITNTASTLMGFIDKSAEVDT